MSSLYRFKKSISKPEFIDANSVSCFQAALVDRDPNSLTHFIAGKLVGLFCSWKPSIWCTRQILPLHPSTCLINDHGSYNHSVSRCLEKMIVWSQRTERHAAVREREAGRAGSEATSRGQKYDNSFKVTGSVNRPWPSNWILLVSALIRQGQLHFYCLLYWSVQLIVF